MLTANMFTGCWLTTFTAFSQLGHKRAKCLHDWFGCVWNSFFLKNGFACLQKVRIYKCDCHQAAGRVCLFRSCFKSIFRVIKCKRGKLKAYLLSKHDMPRSSAQLRKICCFVNRLPLSSWQPDMLSDREMMHGSFWGFLMWHLHDCCKKGFFFFFYGALHYLFCFFSARIWSWEGKKEKEKVWWSIFACETLVCTT